MVPARHNPARKDESVQLSAMFAEAGWEPADQHFRERPFVIWHGSFYSVSGTPPNGSPCSKSCQIAEEVLAFLEQKTAEGIPERTAKPETLTPPTRPTTFAAGWDEPRIKAIEARLDALEARSTGDTDLAPWASPDVRVALDPFVPMEADAVQTLREQVADLQRRLAERDAEPPPLSPDPVKHMIPEEIRKLMEDGESLSNAKRRLTELLWVEQAELRNLRGTDRGDLKREAEIERLLGLFARLGEI